MRKMLSISQGNADLSLNDLAKKLNSKSLMALTQFSGALLGFSHTSNKFCLDSKLITHMTDNCQPMIVGVLTGLLSEEPFNPLFSALCSGNTDAVVFLLEAHFSDVQLNTGTSSKHKEPPFWVFAKNNPTHFDVLLRFKPFRSALIKSAGDIADCAASHSNETVLHTLLSTKETVELFLTPGASGRYPLQTAAYSDNNDAVSAIMDAIEGFFGLEAVSKQLNHRFLPHRHTVLHTILLQSAVTNERQELIKNLMSKGADLSDTSCSYPVNATNQYSKDGKITLSASLYETPFYVTNNIEDFKVLFNALSSEDKRAELLGSTMPSNRKRRTYLQYLLVSKSHRDLYKKFLIAWLNEHGKKYKDILKLSTVFESDDLNQKVRVGSTIVDMQPIRSNFLGHSLLMKQMEWFTCLMTCLDEDTIHQTTVTETTCTDLPLSWSPVLMADTTLFKTIFDKGLRLYDPKKEDVVRDPQGVSVLKYILSVKASLRSNGGTYEQLLAIAIKQLIKEINQATDSRSEKASPADKAGPKALQIWGRLLQESYGGSNIETSLRQVQQCADYLIASGIISSYSTAR